MENQCVGVLRARMRTQHTYTLVEKDGWRRSRSLSGDLAPTVERALIFLSHLDLTQVLHLSMLYA